MDVADVRGAALVDRRAVERSEAARLGLSLRACVRLTDVRVAGSAAAARTVVRTLAAGRMRSGWRCDTTQMTAKNAMTKGAVSAVATPSTILAPISPIVRFTGLGGAGLPVD